MGDPGDGDSRVKFSEAFDGRLAELIEYFRNELGRHALKRALGRTQPGTRVVVGGEELEYARSRVLRQGSRKAAWLVRLLRLVGPPVVGAGAGGAIALALRAEAASLSHYCIAAGVTLAGVAMTGIGAYLDQR